MDTKNSQYGTKWITNGKINKKIKKSDEIPCGFYAGRKNVHTTESKQIISQKSSKLNNPAKRKETIIRKYGSLEVFESKRIEAANEYWVKERQKKIDMDFDNKSMFYKRKQILMEQQEMCLHCKLSTWLGKKIKLELDHVDGNQENNSRENLRFLCPNCHSFTNTWRKRKTRV